MRSSSKSRNRGRNANRRSNNGGSIINRVFDSAGPEGKVRGTPQQIIDKYNSLAHDSQLSGDRVSAENFQQHAEHYQRILSEAQKEIAEKLKIITGAKQIKLALKVDPELIGGFTVEMGSTFIDTSIKNQLSQLANTLGA